MHRRTPHQPMPSPERRRLLRQGSQALLLGAAWPAGLLAAPQAEAPASGHKLPPVFLRDHYRPVEHETVARQLAVRGSIPSALSGMHLRNGHNPKPGVTPPFWFDGSGMVHGVRLHAGRAEWYRNRWVDTPALHGAPLFRPDHSIDFAASVAGTSVVAHAGKILALQEVNLPYEIDAELDTVGVHDFDGRLKSNMTAHPKLDPETGEMLFIGASPVKPHLAYHRVDAHGQLVQSELVDGAGPSVMHDFAITRKHVVLFDTSVVFNPQAGLPFPYAWDTRYPARIGVLPRERTQGPVKWLSVPPYFMFHVSNAWDDAQGRIVVEGTYWDEQAWEHTSRWINNVPGHGAWPGRGMRRARWLIDADAGTVKTQTLDELSVDFPAIRPSYATRANRYSWFVAFADASLRRHALVRYDNQTGERQLREFPEGQMPSEPCLAADPAAQGESDGWLLSFVSDMARGRSELLILDAHDIRKTPVASVEIPAWVPAGVHGTWISDAELHARR